MIYREKTLKNSPFISCKSLTILCLIITLDILLNINFSYAQSDDPFEATPPDDTPSVDTTPAASASGKTIIKVPTPGGEKKTAETSSDDSLLSAMPTPTPTPKGNVTEDELLSNKESGKKLNTPTNENTPEIQELSLEDANNQKSQKNKKTITPKIKKIEKIEKGALNSFDMEHFGKDHKMQTRQNKEKMAPVKIYGRDSETGVMQTIDTQNDGHRYSLVYHTNANLKKAQDLTTLEFLFGYKMENKKVPLWAEFIIFKTSAKFSSIALPNRYMNVPNRSVLDDTNESLMGLGGGVSLRSNWIQDFINTERWSESTSAQIYYITMSEKYSSQNYKGYGIKAHFSLNYRLSQSIQIGPKFGYYLASLNYPQENKKPSDQRSLLITWASMGLDFTYYFK